MTEDSLVAKALFDDKRAERRFRYIKLGVLTSLAAAYLFIFSSLGSEKSGADEKSSQSHVAVVEMRGTISDGGDISFNGVRKHLKSAFEDQAAKAVVLRLNSPGGAPVQASLIHDEIKRLKAQHPGKKVIAVAEDYVASGGYFIAMAADELVVNRSTMAGSIGVISSGFGFTGLLEKIGVERRAFTAGESKNGMDPFLPLAEKDKAKYDELLKSIYGHFTQEVLASRKDKLKAPPEQLFTGAVWTGEQAVNLGLADSLGSISTVMAEVKAEEMVVYGPRPTLADLLGTKIGIAFADRALAKVAEAPTSSLR